MKQVLNHKRLVDYTLFADINISLDELAKKFDWEPIKARDDLDEFKAVVVNVLKEEVIVQEYLNSPEGMGLAVRVSSESNQVEKILNKFSKEIGINLDDFNWIHVGLDRKLLDYKEEFSIRKALHRIGVRSVKEADSKITGENFRVMVEINLDENTLTIKNFKKEIFRGDIPQDEESLIESFQGMF